MIISKNTIKRAKMVYIPCVLLITICLFLLAEITTKPSLEFQNYSQSFKEKTPIVYNENYNIGLFGLEELHPFDSKKYGRVFNFLQQNGFETENFINAQKVSKELLAIHHTQEYLDSLQSSWTLARITELGFLRFFPSKLSRNVVLEPMLYQTGGSLMAAQAALEHGWAINLGGGFHHASSARGEGFCALADISLIIKFLRQQNLAQKIMIIDLDAHQGNGHQRDFVDDLDVYIFDVYNKEVYPQEHEIKTAIDLKVELKSFSGDIVYKNELIPSLEKAFREFKPDIVIYVAGTDVLEGDPLGGLSLSKQAVIERDERVFQAARARDTPIVMLLSGGYQKSNASVIAESIMNLKQNSYFVK